MRRFQDEISGVMGFSPGATGNRSPLQIHNRGFSASNTVLLTCVIGNPPCAHVLPSHRSSLQWRTFVPAAKAASVHSCAHSAVRVGFPTPFLLGRHLTVFRPLRYPPHSILGHDSLSGPVSPQSHSYHTRFPRKSQRSAPCKTALYCRTAKNRRSGAESPCFAGKKDV